MPSKLAALLFLAVSLVGVATGMSSCDSALQSCLNDFSKARFDDWNALTAFNDCIAAVECHDDTLGVNKKNFLLQDIASKQHKWGQDWDVMNEASTQNPPLAHLVILLPALLVFSRT